MLIHIKEIENCGWIILSVILAKVWGVSGEIGEISALLKSDYFRIEIVVLLQ